MSRIPKCRLETYWANKEVFRLDTAIIFRLDTAIIFHLDTAINFRLDTAMIFRLDTASICRLQVVRKSTSQFSPSSRSQVHTAVFAFKSFASPHRSLSQVVVFYGKHKFLGKTCNTCTSIKSQI